MPLPKGYTLDDMLTPEQFCAWQQRSLKWFRSRKHLLPGVVRESTHTRIHPRTYLNSRLKGKAVTM